MILEELIRAVAEGKTEGTPETVLAMLQSRLGRLPAATRTALSAASIFGSVFWQGGVAALLGPQEAATLEKQLRELASMEIIQRHTETRLAGEAEYGFRHDLVRDAAYSLLADEDRVLGHLLCAQYLEGAGEHDALTLAEHYRLGGAAPQAARWYHRAAEQAFESNELKMAYRRAQSAIDIGAEGVERGKLHGLQAHAAYWQRDDTETQRCADKGLAFLVPGTVDWYQCAALMLVSSGRLRDWELVQKWLNTVLATPPGERALPARTVCLARTGYMFMMQGRPAEMKRMVGELGRSDEELPDCDPVAQAQLAHFRSAYAIFTGDVVSGVKYLEATISAFERAGDLRNALLERSNLACSYIEAGLFTEAVQTCRQNIDECERRKAPAARTLALTILGYALTFFPDQRSQAQACLEEATAKAAAAQNPRHEGWGRSAMARLFYLEGRFADSEVEARRALELLQGGPTFLAWPLGWLARALLKQGRVAEALSYAEQSIFSLKKYGDFTMDVSIPPLAYIEALQAAGQPEAARREAESTKRRLLRRADRITEPVWRSKLLTHPENAQILAMTE